ncbi:GNAT family N-acetyltransferase [uncultured Amnibacterium sp.]|uniref:GNAT family N-acetyltransferase n=1 Tax=uncultured Amnibacterium sp. TaxID=1631851 RepID=UPI0035CC54F3
MIGSLAFATDLALLASQGAVVEREAHRTVVRMPANPAFRWGNFLLVAAAGDPAARVAEHEAAFPDAGFVTVGVDAAHPVLDEGAWLTAGFAVERLAVLVADRVGATGAAAVRLLASDDDWAAETAIALEEDGGDAEHADFSRLRTAEKRRMVDAGRAVWLGVEADGALVATAGIADAGRGTARFQDVQTLAVLRRRGFAGALIAAGVRVASQRFGSARFVLVAERAGPAIGLYRRLGFREVETQLQLTRLDAPPGMDG